MKAPRNLCPIVHYLSIPPRFHLGARRDGGNFKYFGRVGAAGVECRYVYGKWKMPSLTIGVIGFLPQDGVFRMIPHFDFDAPQLPVALRVCRVISEDVAALDARENPVVDSSRLPGLFEVFRPSTRQIGDAGQGELLAKRSLGARPEVVFERRRQLTPPPAPFLLRLKQFAEQPSRPFNVLFRRDSGEPDAGDDGVDRRPRLFRRGVNIFEAVLLEGIVWYGADLRAGRRDGGASKAAQLVAVRLENNDRALGACREFFQRRQQRAVLFASPKVFGLRFLSQRVQPVLELQFVSRERRQQRDVVGSDRHSVIRL